MLQQEQLSAFMDGDKPAPDFIDEITSSSALRQKWQRYHQIRSVMRGEAQILGDDFADRMAAALENERIEKSNGSTLSEPKPQAKMLKLKRWATPLWQAGLAASVCLMTVFGVQQFQQNQEPAVADTQPALMTVPFSNAVQAVSYNAPLQTQPTAERLEAQQQLLNSLLQNHELQRRSQSSAVTLSEEQKAKSQTSAIPANGQ